MNQKLHETAYLSPRRTDKTSSPVESEIDAEWGGKATGYFRLKRALKARGKGCSFPGCHHKRFVDAHHVQHWSAGGETSLDNLVLLCSKHHKLVHEGGFTIQRDYQNHWFFKRPDGRAVPACGYSLKDMIDDDIGNVSRQAGPQSRLPGADATGLLALASLDQAVSS